MEWEELYEKYGGKPPGKMPEKPPERKKDRRLIITVLFLGLVFGSIVIIFIVTMLSLTGVKTLELKSGFRYEYPLVNGYTSSAIEIYGTKESWNSWEGITVVKSDEEMEIMLGRFKIDENLNLFLSNPLSKEELLDENINLYKLTELKDPSMVEVLLPFAVLLYKEYGMDIDELIEKRSTTIPGMGTLTLAGPVEHNGYLSYELSTSSGYGSAESKIYISTVRPYMLIGALSYGTNYSLNKVEQKAFNLVDYEEYEVYTTSTGGYRVPCSPCFSTFAYIDYSDDTLMLRTGSRSMNHLQLFTDNRPILTLSWVNGTSATINPGTTLVVSGFQTGKSYSLTLNYTDVDSGLIHQDFAVLHA